MRARIICCFISLGLIVSGVNANQKGPVVISPGIETGIAVVGQSCPTFSWTAVEWAVAYRVVVFETNGPNVLAYKETEAIASPVLAKEIQGRALSWTPSSEERLSNGIEYVWYVQALDTNGVGMWSEGKVFKVDVGIRFDRVEERVSERLREHGVSDDVIDDVLKDVKETLEQGLDEQSISNITQNVIGIQGTEGSLNTFYGLEAGFSIASGGGYNSFFGRSAGYSTTVGDNNTFIGTEAGYANTGSSNTFIGAAAGRDNTTGVSNIFIGVNVGRYNTTGNSNTFMGTAAGLNNTASWNTFMGTAAGRNNTTGNSNTFMGYYAGYSNTTGFQNTFLGNYAGRNNTTGNSNTFMGYYAGYSNTTGGTNSFIGYTSGYSNTIGASNTFIGFSAGYANTEGDFNTFLGRHSGGSNLTGLSNTFLGFQAGKSNVDGSTNTFIGQNAGYSNTSGAGNVFLGSQAGYNETGSNKLYIDNSNTSSPLIWGDFNSDILAVNGKFCIGTQYTPYRMEVETTGINAAVVVDRTDGATNYINATANYANFGSVSAHPLRFVVGGKWQMILYSDGSLTMSSGATCTSFGSWVNASSRKLKENIEDLSAEAAMDALDALNPVTFNYKVEKEESCVGFIAEDVPEIVATKDRKGISPMDVVAVLTKVVQEQRDAIDDLKKEIAELKKNK